MKPLRGYPCPLADCTNIAGWGEPADEPRSVETWANSVSRIRTGVRTVTGALDELLQVRLVEFHYPDAYRAQHPSLKDRSYLNAVAQELEKLEQLTNLQGETSEYTHAAGECHTVNEYNDTQTTCVKTLLQETAKKTSSLYEC